MRATGQMIKIHTIRKNCQTTETESAMFTNWSINNPTKKSTPFSTFTTLIHYAVTVSTEKEWAYSTVRDKIVWKLMALF